MPLQLRQLEVFRAVMHAGTVSGAARLLDISQPAASTMLKALEVATGLQLFDRVAGRLRPTAEAQALHAEVQRSFRGLEELDRVVAQLRGFNAVQLRLGALHALSGHLLPRAVKAFRTVHPGVRLSLQVQSSNEVRDQVQAGRLDLGLVADEARIQGLRASTFYRVPAACAFPRGHRFERLWQVTLADLQGEPFIALNPEDRMRERLERDLRKVGAALDTVVETPYSATLCALALEGVGVSLVNPLTALPYLPLGLRIRRFAPSIDFHGLLVFPVGRPQSPVVRTLIATLRRALDEDLKEIEAVLR